MLPYEILVGLRGTMCICARGLTGKQSTFKQLNSRVQSLYNFSTNSATFSSTLEAKCQNIHINGLRRFHTNLLTHCQASPNDSKVPEANIPLNDVDPFDGMINTETKEKKDYTFNNRNAENIPESIKKWLFSEVEKLPDKNIASQFLEPKVYLNNIYTLVSNETKIPQCLVSSSKHHHLKKKMGWSHTYLVKWPEEKSFTSVAHSKAAASESAALKCLYWLQINKRIHNRLPVIYQYHEKLSILKAPDEFKIDKNILNKMNDFINSYEEAIQSSLAKSSNQENHMPNNTMKLNKQHPISFMQVDTEMRNKSLEERLKRRKQITNTELPIFQYKSQILQQLEENQALVIKGDTGCGKTTQVPQFIIDHFTEKGVGAECSMVVTQPRRISAISLAERVAYERGENVGDVVGYQVRLQQLLPKQNGSMLFCTTGILLKKMQSNLNLEGCSHVIIDEAHERSLDTDMLLVLLRRAMRNNPDLRVVIMSATINADLFQDYLSCKSVEVPGRLFPVKMHLLDDLLDYDIPFRKPMDIIENAAEPTVNSDQVTDLIRWIHDTKPPGAILCFLPGWGHIQRIQMNLDEYGAGKFEVIPLHSKIPYMDQNRIFKPPPMGKRKVILSTDIAETGITVPDVVYVVDSACHKETRWHESKGLSSIDTQWISKANLNQRKGRAGRVQKGESYHLISKKQYEQLDSYPVPEVLRISLEKTVLDCKTYSNEKVDDFLGSMPQPPRKSAVFKAVKDLQILGALDTNENLTPLGKRISLFSIHPKLSKSLVYSSIFQCLNPVATVSAALSLDSEIFYGTLENKRHIRETKTRFHPTSDHIAISWIHAQWQDYLKHGRQSAYNFCRKNRLHAERVSILDKVRELNLELLREANMIVNTRQATNLSSEQNEFSVLDELVRGVLLAGMDQILKHRNFEMRKGRFTKSGTSMVMEDDAKAQLATESVNHKRKSWPSPYLVYFQKTHHQERRTTMIRDSSMISPVSVLLFSQGQITGIKYKDEAQNEDKILLKISGKENVQLMCDKETAQTILRFRDIMWSVVQFYIENDIRGGIFADRNESEGDVFNIYKREMLKVLGTLLVSTSESIDSIDVQSENTNDN